MPRAKNKPPQAQTIATEDLCVLHKSPGELADEYVHGVERDLAAEPADASRPFKTLDIPLLPLDLVIPSPDNPRILRHDAAFESLTASVKACGVLEPVLVRAHPAKPGCFDLRAGERRYRAAKAAGLAEIPCRVMDLDDAEAVNVTVVENLEREDLHPLEEARGIARLLELGWDEESIASRLGKSAKWVARRARLTRLIEPFKKAALDPDHELSEAPTGLLEDLARLPVGIQEQLWADCKRCKPNLPWFMRDGRSFNNHVNEHHLRVLDLAPFKLDDALLYPEAGACERCQKRSGCQPLLFGEDEDVLRKRPGDRCLDADCFHEKCRRVLKEKIKQVQDERGKAPVLIDGGAHDYGTPAERIQKAFGNSVQTWGKYEEARKDDPKAVAAVIVNGPGVGREKWVKPRPSSAAARRSSSKSADKADKPKKTEEQKQEERENRLRLMVVDAFREHLDKTADGKKPIDHTPIVGVLLAYLDAFGTDKNETIFWPGEKRKESPWYHLDQTQAKQVSTGELIGRLQRELYRVWAERLTHYGANAGKDAKAYVAEMERMNELVDLDLAALRAEAEKKLSTPKAAAADGKKKARAGK